MSMDRVTRIVEDDEGRWRAVEAWRGRGGVALLYFLRLDDGEVREDDGDDRRACLAADERLDGLTDGELRERLAAGTRLTGTERRFRAPDGAPWLAQSVGPVWAEGGVAEGLTGVVFTALEGPGRRLSGDGGHVGEMEEGDLLAGWRAAHGPGEEPPETEPES